MKIRINDLAALIGGKVEGDGEVVLSGFAPIEEAGPGMLSFIANPKYSHFLNTSRASALLVANDFKPVGDFTPVLIHVQDVYSTLSILLDHFSPAKVLLSGVEDPSFISPDASLEEGAYFGAFSYASSGVRIGKNAQIYPQVFLGRDVQIGEGTIIYSGVKIYQGCRIGANCIIHSGSVIGSDGFGFAPQPNGTYKKIPQNGIVILEDNVEVGANTVIDRATLNATIVRSGVKLDNLIQVAHNVQIGSNTAIAAQAGISGSAHIGDNCQIGGQVGIVGHIRVANGSLIGAQSGVAKPIEEENKKWFGSPAMLLGDAVRSQAVLKKLPELYNRISRIEQELQKNK
jgi:UDP-3-O-[3-hydroxymyristoyl] glucosamine N-acyltransferase